jgi:hypothetical protein
VSYKLETDDDLRAKAGAFIGEDDEKIVNPDAEVDRTPDGAWVQVWVWVAYEEEE